ncbi:MAG: Uma2 family endonuclease [Pirellulales bacterium]
MMVTLITDPALEERLIAMRGAWGGNHHDEVWDGIYIMTPLPNDEHQDIVGGLIAALHGIVKKPGLGIVRPGVNISDRTTDWQQNYRCPDAAVFLNDTKATNHGSYWYGGPDLAIEVISPGDKAREKLAFYGDVGTREVLLIDRDPWQIELYRLDGSKLELIGSSSLEATVPLESQVVGCSFVLKQGKPRPLVRIEQAAANKSWDV